MKACLRILMFLLFALTVAAGRAQSRVRSAQVTFVDGSVRDVFIKKSNSDSSILIWSTPESPGIYGNTQVAFSSIESIALPATRPSFITRTLTGLAGGTIVGIAIGASIYDSEDGGWFEATFDQHIRAIGWGAGIGAAFGLLYGMFTKEKEPQLLLMQKGRLTKKQKRKLNAVSF